MASLQLKNVYKIYPNGFNAVKDFNLDIEDKEFIIFVGPSGCGKSTTLRMIAGLEDISSGELWIGDKMVNDVEPKDRDIAMVFQNYALYPHMSVYDNMAFGLKLRKVPKEKIDKQVHEAAKILDIEHLLDRKPKALSGGQRQRVAMGRAIVREPKVFLMDEPLSNLDAKLRVQMRVEISKLHQRLQTTIIYVTHDQTEAMTLGTRIVVMKDGIIQQVDTPQNLYDKPCNLFVAGFMGMPPMNFIDCKVVKSGADVLLMFGSHSIKVPDAKAQKLISGEISVGSLRSGNGTHMPSLWANRGNVHVDEGNLAIDDVLAKDKIHLENNLTDLAIYGRIPTRDGEQLVFWNNLGRANSKQRSFQLYTNGKVRTRGAVLIDAGRHYGKLYGDNLSVVDMMRERLTNEHGQYTFDRTWFTKPGEALREKVLFGLDAVDTGILQQTASDAEIVVD